MPGGIGSQEPPWKLWGSKINVQVPASASPPPVVVPTIAQVNYGRPETWSFFLAGKLISFDVQAADLTLIADFELVLGVGRAMFDTSPVYQGGIPTGKPFCRMAWIIPAGVSPAAQDSQKFATAVWSPPLDETLATPDPVLVDHIVAQTITAKATVRSSAITAPVYVELVAFFAPRTHVRPDWFRNTDDEGTRFQGDELGGT